MPCSWVTWPTVTCSNHNEVEVNCWPCLALTAPWQRLGSSQKRCLFMFVLQNLAHMSSRSRGQCVMWAAGITGSEFLTASQKAPTAIDCPCIDYFGSLTRFAIINKTAKDLKCKVANLVTKKCRWDLINQVQLAKLELFDLCCNGTPCQPCVASNANKSAAYMKPQNMKSFWKAPEHEELLKSPRAWSAIRRSQSPCSRTTRHTGNTLSLLAPATRYTIPDLMLIAMIVQRSYMLKNTSSRMSKMQDTDPRTRPRIGLAWFCYFLK